jgi:DMSO reductase anchor subunit
MLVFVSFASLAVVIWGIIDVARRPALAVAPKWKALWIAGMIGGWLLFGIIGAIVSVFYLAGPRRRLNAGRYSNRY